MATKKKKPKFPMVAGAPAGTASPLPKAKQVKAAKPMKATLKRISKKYPGRKLRKIPSDY